MAFPTDWGRKCAITIDNTKVAASLTDFPVLISKDMLPSEMFDADGSYPALNGGGDIRFSSDEDGNTQLACEIVSFVTDNNPDNGSCEIWVKVPSVSSSTDTTIYVWYNKSGETQPAVTDTYGRNAVWSAYVAVWHLNESSGSSAVDSSGNGNDAAFAGTLPNATAGKVGGGQSLVKTDGDYAALASNSDFVFGTGDFNMSIWAKISSSAYMNPIHVGADRSLDGVFLRTRISPDSLWVQDRSNDPALISTAFDYPDGNWHYYVANRAGTTWRLNVDNGDINSTASHSSDLTGTRKTMIGGYVDNGSDVASCTGELDEARIIKGSARTNDWITAEYNNQNSPATFAAAGTPVSPGGGFAFNQSYIIH